MHGKMDCAALFCSHALFHVLAGKASQQECRRGGLKGEEGLHTGEQQGCTQGWVQGCMQECLLGAYRGACRGGCRGDTGVQQGWVQ